VTGERGERCRSADRSEDLFERGGSAAVIEELLVVGETRHAFVEMADFLARRGGDE
jgi:hypothetical protein